MHLVDVVPWSMDITYRWTISPPLPSRSPEIPGDRVRRVPNIAEECLGRLAMPVTDPFHRTGNADGTDHQPTVAADRRRDARLARHHFLGVTRPTVVAHVTQCPREYFRCHDRATRERGQLIALLE